MGFPNTKSDITPDRKQCIANKLSNDEKEVLVNANLKAAPGEISFKLADNLSFKALFSKLTMMEQNSGKVNPSSEKSSTSEEIVLEEPEWQIDLKFKGKRTAQDYSKNAVTIDDSSIESKDSGNGEAK